MSATSLGPVCDHDSVMEFGLDQLLTGMRPGSSRFELSRHVEIARTWSQTGSKPNSITLSGRRQFQCWSQTVPKLVADLLARASSLLASSMIGQIPARCRSATTLEPVCDQESVMEFGFYAAADKISTDTSASRGPSAVGSTDSVGTTVCVELHIKNPGQQRLCASDTG